jgi:8-hydroxy-5-deazaflavin:NADPH oxidoreductase
MSNIAILGTGNMASALALQLAAKGYGVVLGSRDAARAQAKASELGQGIQGTALVDAARQAETVFYAGPYGGFAGVAAATGGLAGKVVIDITNPLTADYMGLTLGHTTSAAEELQKLVPQARVVKAFNTVFAQVLQGGPSLNGVPVTVFFAGDDETAKASVKSLIEQLGFNALDSGALKNARYLEPVAGLNIALGYGLGHGTSIAPAWTFGPKAA